MIVVEFDFILQRDVAVDVPGGHLHRAGKRASPIRAPRAITLARTWRVVGPSSNHPATQIESAHGHHPRLHSNHIESALTSVLAIYRNTGPDVKDANDRHDFASAPIAHSNIATAAALLEIAEAIRELRD